MEKINTALKFVLLLGVVLALLSFVEISVSDGGYGFSKKFGKVC